jgi:hypothetical protein
VQQSPSSSSSANRQKPSFARANPAPQARAKVTLLNPSPRSKITGRETSALSPYGSAKIETIPSDPTTIDDISIKVSGLWSDGCIPRDPKVRISGNQIHIESSSPGGPCILIIMPYLLEVSVGKLSAGTYGVTAANRDQDGVGIPLVLGQGSFTVQNPTYYFAHLVVGGGFSTNFTITNTGAATATGNLILTNQVGNPLAVNLTRSTVPSQSASPGDQINSTGFSFPVSVVPSATQSLSATALNLSDREVGWARLESSSGPLAGVATFQYRQGGILQAIAGVLASQPVLFATIPVDNDDSQNRFTGFALANPNNDKINIKLVTVNEDGIVLDTISPELMF